MAKALPELRCALCGRLIDSPDECFRASGDFLPKGDPLTRFCNAPMHWDCYHDWPERRRFARHHVDAWAKANRRNPFWWTVHQDDKVYVSVNPSRPIEQASVRLYELGNDIRVPLPKWSAWLANVDAVTPHLHACEREALKKILPKLKSELPSDHSLVDAIDPHEKRPGRGRGERAAVDR